MLRIRIGARGATRGRSRRRGSLALIAATAAIITVVGASTASAGATLVRVVDTSVWRHPSPDPSGIARIGSTNRFVVVDGEVDETRHWESANVWVTRGSLRPVTSWSTRRFTNEPTDIAMPSPRLAYISDDSGHRVFRVKAGADGRLGTADDNVSAFSTRTFRCRDPEGIAFARGTLFIVNGEGRKIVRLQRGRDHRFGTEDDRIHVFGTTALGLREPEGVAAFGGDVYLVSRREQVIVRATPAGELVTRYDISSSGIDRPSGITVSMEDGVLQARVTDRGVDNDERRHENDGAIYVYALT